MSRPSCLAACRTLLRLRRWWRSRQARSSCAAMRPRRSASRFSRAIDYFDHGRKSMRKLFGALAIAAAATAVSLAGTAIAQQPLRIGFVYVGPIGDGGWTFAHDIGRKSLEAKLKGKVQTTYVESVPEGADAE